MDKLIELAKQIIEVNPTLILSGSIALKLQGVNIRREPSDIDFFIPYGQYFKLLTGMKDVKIEMAEFYEDEEYELTRFSIGQTTIDVLRPFESDCRPLHTYTFKGIKLIHRDDIIAFKMKFALDSMSYSRWKHKDDIIHMMVNN